VYSLQSVIITFSNLLQF